MKKILLTLLVLLLSCSSNEGPDIEVYQIHDARIQLMYMNCRCRHECYYLFTENEIWWYAEAHLKKEAEYSHQEGKKKFYQSTKGHDLIFIEKDIETYSNILLGDKLKLKRIKVSEDVQLKMLEDIKHYKEK